MDIVLTSKTLKMHSRTFEPVIEAVIMIPVEPIQGDKELDSAFYENLGRTLITLLKAKYES